MSSTTMVTPWIPTSVRFCLLDPTPSRSILVRSLICASVTWNGPSASQRLRSSVPSCKRSESSPRLLITCQTTNHPTSPRKTKPHNAVRIVASPFGTLCR